MFGLDVKRGILTDEDRRIMREHTLNNKTIDNLKAGEKYRFKKGDPSVGVYKRSNQTIERLLKQIKRINLRSKNE